jgi:hypothetical protein
VYLGVLESIIENAIKKRFHVDFSIVENLTIIKCLWINLSTVGIWQKSAIKNGSKNSLDHSCMFQKSVFKASLYFLYVTKIKFNIKIKKIKQNLTS